MTAPYAPPLTLSLEQVTALFDGQRVIGPARDIQEVRKAIAAGPAPLDWARAERLADAPFGTRQPSPGPLTAQASSQGKADQGRVTLASPCPQKLTVLAEGSTVIL